MCWNLIRQGMLTRGDKNNRVYVGETVTFDSGVSGEMQSALFDPQTAGGLLISIEEDNAASFLTEVPEARVIGTVAEGCKADPSKLNDCNTYGSHFGIADSIY